MGWGDNDRVYVAAEPAVQPFTVEMPTEHGLEIVTAVPRWALNLMEFVKAP